MNRSERVLMTIAAVVSISLTGCSAIEALTTPSYNLTQIQRDKINESARLGYDGLTRFEWTYQEPYGTTNIDAVYSDRDKSEVPPIKLGESFTSHESLETLASKRGYSPRDDGEEMDETNNFTPTVTEDGAYIAYIARFVNVAGKSYTTTVLRNPDATLFGSDGIVSVDEMLTFYNDPATELVSMKHKVDDVSWNCTINLELKGNSLRTNAANSCSKYVDDSSTDQLVIDLVDRFV